MEKILLLSLLLLVYYPWTSKGFVNLWTRSPNRITRWVDQRLAAEANKKGTLSLVGAGPGDPDLLTIQAMKLISTADLVIADRLISSEILALVKCELKVANKKPGCAEEAQEEIYEWVIDAVSKGKNVVRLKIGDPYLFGRGGEEVLEYREKLGVDPLVAPGLSSSYAAPLVAKIPLTHRDVANNVLISTGYGKNGSTVDVPEYRSDRTVVLLMAIGRLGEIVDMMKDKNYDLETPVAIIENATTPRERILYGTVNSIVAVATEKQAKPPAIIVVGKVVDVLR